MFKKYVFSKVHEQGFALVTTMFVLLILTFIGIAATNTSSIEVMISSAQNQSQENFYVAEAGMTHARGMLKGLFVSRNSVKIAAGITPDWDFALNGSLAGVNAAGSASYAGSALLISGGSLGDNYATHHLYDVRVWNNQDGGGATNDTDGLIFVRADATGPGGSAKSIEILLQGTTGGGGAVTGYTAQAGAGAGKNYEATDVNAIADFSTQF